jgi:BioD-like phosphotransacetylase family protein
MPALVIASLVPLSGKTAVAAGLAYRLQRAGRSVAAVRLAGDGHAEADARLFAALPANAQAGAEPVDAAAAAEAKADVLLAEAPAGDPKETVSRLSAKVILVAPYADPIPEDVVSLRASLGGACTGVIMTRAPKRRLDEIEKAAAGLGLLAVLPEDRTLAAPCLGDVAAALEAETSQLDGVRENVIDRPVISSISVDPAQGYFTHANPNAVIVRGDKPDQQLGALNAGAPCLIVTGGLPVLSYVQDRAAEERVPIVRTALDTIETVRRLEALYGTTPFSGAAKVERSAELLAGLDLSALA